jgi:predicted flavoprotein YhiN
MVDLLPDRGVEQLTAALSRPRGKASLASQLRKAAGIEGVKAALLRETADAQTLAVPARLAAHLKALPLTLTAARPLAEAISTAGGVALDEIDAQFMLRRLPGVFVAGEMLDWEAPTGGYLLSACLATGRAAGRGALGFSSAHRSQERLAGAARRSGSQERLAGAARRSGSQERLAGAGAVHRSG